MLFVPVYAPDDMEETAYKRDEHWRENKDSSATSAIANSVLSTKMEQPTLIILGGIYGLGNVTAKLQSLVQNNALTVTANNQTFGDKFPMHVKTLVVVYQYGSDLPQTVIAPENTTINISYVSTAKYQPVPGYSPS